MTQIRPFKKSRRSIVTSLAAAVIFAAGLAAGGQLDSTTGHVTADGNMEDQPEFSTLEDTWNLVQANYVDESALQSDLLLYGAAKGMVDSLGDTGHSSFLDPEETKSFNDMSEGAYIGIGIQLDNLSQPPVIVMTLPGSPAEAAGLKAGDVIVAIDSQTTESLSNDQVGDLISGSEGTTVSLKVERPGEAQPLSFQLTRSRIELSPVDWAMLPDNLSMIRINEFSDGAGDALVAAVAAVKANGAQGVLLDLRDNPGGYLDEAMQVANTLLPSGKTVFQEEDRDGNTKASTTSGDDTGDLDLPVVVLTNGNTASAAEIITTALQESGGVTVVGETTFGTGTILSPFALSDGSMVLLGTSQWLTPNKEEIWKVGIEPNISVELTSPLDVLRPADGSTVDQATLNASTDLQFKKGLSVLEESPTIPENSVQQGEPAASASDSASNNQTAVWMTVRFV